MAVGCFLTLSYKVGRAGGQSGEEKSATTTWLVLCALIGAFAALTGLLVLRPIALQLWTLATNRTTSEYYKAKDGQVVERYPARLTDQKFLFV